ncbi:hypothetical protein GJ672_07540 [Spiribacter sp. 2438]|uniref:GspH/FimT family pseudopilin n=1 Tax=Spiribacter sp. 2438 TaxID=2666185 RepID=UPI0012AF29C6|nr:GspH/FimT family pseudopilin [Spiribacter sp. 2438]QGM22124.1 hypothetical protein GJ672_07540 [Spiribacter sp. 2438]
MEQNGYTLIGLMAAIGLAALVTGLGMPSFLTAWDRHALTLTADRLMADIAYARHEAMLRGERVVLEPRQEEWRSGWRVRLAMDPPGEGPNLRTQPPLPDRQALETNAGIGSRLTYRPDGRSEGPGGGLQMGRFFLCLHQAGTAGRSIVISSTGRARLSRDPADLTGSRCAPNP